MSDESLLDLVNGLLPKLGVTDKPFTHVDEVLDNASSLLAAIFEALFVVRIEGLRRIPTVEEDYVVNAELVLQSLRRYLPSTVVVPQGISGESIVAGDKPAIMFVFSLMNDVYKMLQAQKDAEQFGTMGLQFPIAAVGTTDSPFKQPHTSPFQQNTSSASRYATIPTGTERHTASPAGMGEDERVNLSAHPSTVHSSPLLSSAGISSPLLSSAARSSPLLSSAAHSSPLLSSKGGAPRSQTQPAYTLREMKHDSEGSGAFNSLGREPQHREATHVYHADAPAHSFISSPAQQHSLHHTATTATKPVASRAVVASHYHGAQPEVLAAEHAGFADASSQPAVVTQVSVRPLPVTKALSGAGAKRFGSAATQPHIEQGSEDIGEVVNPVLVPGSDYEQGIAIDREGAGRPATAPHSQAAPRSSRPAGGLDVAPPLVPGTAAFNAQADVYARRAEKQVAGGASATRVLAAPGGRLVATGETSAPHGRPLSASGGPRNSWDQAVMAKTAAASRTRTAAPPASASRRSLTRPSSSSGAQQGTVNRASIGTTHKANNLARPQALRAVGLGSTIQPPSVPNSISGPTAPNLAAVDKENRVFQVRKAPSPAERLPGPHGPSATGSVKSRPSPADVLEREHKLRAASASAVLRRHRMLMQHIESKGREELLHLNALNQLVVKSRESDMRRLESSAVRQATLRARAARHERKVLVIRTQRVCEDLKRHTLSLRVSRSSKQAAAASALLKAYSSQVKAAAADELRAAATDRAAQLVVAQGSLAAVAQAMALAAEVTREETAKQIAQRQAALQSQREALNRAIREMKVDQNALLQAIKDEQSHAEDVFLAHNVEPIHPSGARSAGPGAPDAVQMAKRHLHQHVDIDVDPAYVDTQRRVEGTLNRFEQGFAARADAASAIIKDSALDAARASHEAQQLDGTAV